MTLFGMMNIQMFGYKKCQVTRAAQRFFKERGVTFHFVDMAIKPMSAGELQRVASVVPHADLINEHSKAYKDGGYTYREIDILEELLEHPELFNTPIIRNGKNATAGSAESVWKRWIDEDKG